MAQKKLRKILGIQPNNIIYDKNYLYLANNMENTVNETQTQHGLTYYEGQLNSYREKLGIGPLQTEQPSPLKSKSAVQEEETEEVCFFIYLFLLIFLLFL